MKNFVEVINCYRKHGKKFDNCDTLDVALELLSFSQEISDFWRQYVESEFLTCDTGYGTAKEQCCVLLERKLKRLLQLNKDNKGRVWLWRILTDIQAGEGGI